MCSCFCSNLCIVMYRKFRNVPLFKFFSLICSSFWNLKVGKYDTCCYMKGSTFWTLDIKCVTQHVAGVHDWDIMMKNKSTKQKKNKQTNKTKQKNKKQTKTKQNKTKKLGVCCLKNPNLSQSMHAHDMKIKINR